MWVVWDMIITLVLVFVALTMMGLIYKNLMLSGNGFKNWPKSHKQIWYACVVAGLLMGILAFCL